MKKHIRNRDKDGKLICYYPNGNICNIDNYYHGLLNGYSAWFKICGLTNVKEYFNMGNKIYIEDHLFNKEIQIKI